MKENGEKRINFFAHLLSSKTFTYGYQSTSQQSYKTDVISSTFHQVGNVKECRICGKPVEAESLFSLFLSDVGN